MQSTMRPQNKSGCQTLCPAPGPAAFRTSTACPARGFDPEQKVLTVTLLCRTASQLPHTPIRNPWKTATASSCGFASLENFDKRLFVLSLNSVDPPLLIVKIKDVQRQLMVREDFYPDGPRCCIDQAGQQCQTVRVLKVQRHADKLRLQTFCAEQDDAAYVKAGTDEFQQSASQQTDQRHRLCKIGCL